jgi:pyruvate dehydrogenase E2 component (dihydrolipoamide acetyltransferase)
MEVGSIVKWDKKEGDRFEAGDAICEVETDKATVTYEATDGGYLAKILIGSGEIKVGQPLMITVEEKESVAAFANYSSSSGSAASSSSAPAPVAKQAAAPAAPAASPAAAVTAAPAAAVAPSGGRVVASPYAKTLAKESGVDLASVGAGSGPNGRIIAADVIAAKSRPAAAPAVTAATPAAAVAASSSSAATRSAPSSSVAGATDFALSPIAEALAGLYATSKKTVPHYHLSVELNLARAERLLAVFNKDREKDKKPVISVQDLLVKAAALAMRKVPVANATWMDTFVRCYDRVSCDFRACILCMYSYMLCSLGYMSSPAHHRSTLTCSLALDQR